MRATLFRVREEFSRPHGGLLQTTIAVKQVCYRGLVNFTICRR